MSHRLPLACVNAGHPRTVHCSSRCSPKGLHSLTWETLSRGFRGQHGDGSGGDPASPAAPRRRPARSAPPTARTIRLASCRVGSSFGARTASPRLLSAADDASGPNRPETFRGGRSPASIQGRETSRCESCTQERCTALESGADSALAGPALGPSARSGMGALRPHVEADWRRRGPRGRGEGRGPVQGGGPRCCEMTGVLAVEARDTARQRHGLHGRVCGRRAEQSSAAPCMGTCPPLVLPSASGADLHRQRVDGHVLAPAPRASRTLIPAPPGCRPVSPPLSSGWLKGPLFIDK